jgi:hypothetical protein
VSAVALRRAGARGRRNESARARAGTRRRGDEVASGQIVLGEDVGGEPTLDALVSGVWEGLAAHRAEPCPMCGGEMAPAYGAHTLPIGGTCRSCGTTLS